MPISGRAPSPPSTIPAPITAIATIPELRAVQTLSAPFPNHASKHKTHTGVKIVKSATSCAARYRNDSM